MPGSARRADTVKFTSPAAAAGIATADAVAEDALRAGSLKKPTPAPVGSSERPRGRKIAVRTPLPFPLVIDASQRQQLIAKTAYFLAEARGFAPGHEMGDWIEAERLVQERLGPATHSGSPPPG